MGLFKNKSKKLVQETSVQNNNEQPTSEQFVDPASNVETQDPISKRGKKIVDSSNQGNFRASDVYDVHAGYKKKRSSYVPTAKESAFDGPPRYDWVDVESAAAIKVQSVFRRNQALRQLEKDGKSTAAMRNRARSRQANGYGKGNGNGNAMAGEDVPFAMRLCGIGMLFGDATGEDNDALNSNKEIQAKRVKDKEMQETNRRKFRMRKKSTEQLEEAIEVVDDIRVDDDENYDGDEMNEQREESKGKDKKKGRFRFSRRTKS